MLKIGQTLSVRELSGPKDIKYKLYDLGITKGVKLTLISKSPLGDPFNILVRGYNLAIEKELAIKIKGTLL